MMDRAVRQPTVTNGPKLRVRTWHVSGPGLPFLGILFLVVSGWALRARMEIDPASGVGYALGVAGSSSMLLLLLYSARKRLRFTRTWAPLKHWFRVHMILGVVGPTLILFHCNFHLGAPNSNVALGSMLLIAASGVVGRYIYTQISHGLYGARASREELHAQLEATRKTIDAWALVPPPIVTGIVTLDATAQAGDESRWARLHQIAALPLTAGRTRRRALRDLRRAVTDEGDRQGWNTAQRREIEATMGAQLDAFVTALVKEAQFGIYERMFSLWHALHVPLVVLLLFAGCLHVVAVHMY